MSHPTGINWSSNNQSSKPPSTAFSNLSLKPTPLSSRTTFPGALAPQNGSASKKAGDSFSNLVSFGRDKQNANPSLLEQQKKLEEQRRKDDEERQKKMDALFGGGGGAADGFWNALDGKGSGVGSSPAPAHTVDDDDDILAAFNSAAPVDNSSHFPPPPSFSSPPASSSAGIDMLLDPTPSKLRTSTPSDPFDPFDVENLPSRDRFPAQPAPQTQYDDDFDILGDLAKPVSELPPRPQPSPKPESRWQPSPPPLSDSRDHAIAEIMDMGFTAEQAKQALAETKSEADVEAAVGWLLEQAHRKSKPATSNERPRGNQSRWETSQDGRERESDEDDSVPVWARGGKSGGEKVLGAYAAEVGGTLFKSANSLWSTGRKKVEKAVAEFKADLADGGGDPNQPKWMRERQIREELEKRGARGISRNDRPSPGQFDDDDDEPISGSKQKVPITDEALMLEMGSGPPQPRRKQGGERPPPTAPSRDLGMSEREQIQRQRMQDMEAAIREKEREMRERERARAASAIPDSATRRAKLAVENEPVYVSRNRRRPPPAAPPKPSTPEPDLLSGGSGGGRAGSSSLNPFARDIAVERQRTAHPPTPTPTPPPRRRPPPQQRPNVPISPSAISKSSAARQQGTEAFKRGDYTAAQAFYTTALNPIPDLHPLRIIVLTNRSLCTVKLGDPKSALIDVDAILTLIGESRGEGETISLDGAEKEMKEYWTKAVSRKAECLEQLEKWADAKAAWELALTAGSNAAAINGKRRCETALKPKAPPKPKPKPVAAPRRPPPVSAKPSGAVTALRQANAAQEKQEAERLELHDVVHERIGNWKNGKEGNLRALLAGLDTVLWEGSGWKKVGMGELLVPQKCKIAYMKGIAKVHPDKIRPDATTEQRMISGAVFSLLNESWDKFKAENGL
ncbi:hypothetical protein K440DRAFT_633998 [Wilcoxina mikolae CBS 423.85]|nr:hypothetical protein K440DRAFT_633998 [Wilcoxina mikolae CBS 423.85]